MEKKKGEKVEYVGYTSSKLRFSISIPSDWRVHTDRLELESGPSWEEVYEAFRQTFPDSNMSLEDFKKAGKPPTAEEAYEKLLETYEGLSEEEYPRVSFTEFKEQYEWEQEQEREKERKRAELTQEEGYFGASSSTDKDDYPSVEVTRLKLTRPMTPLELYQLDKPSPEAVPMGKRPSKGVIVDGLHGIKYYYIFDTGETRYTAEMPKFFNVYLTEGQMGWIISCCCIARAFSKYKSVFTTIVDSFRRI